MTELTQEQMEELSKKAHKRDLQFLEDEKEKLRLKWEPSGLLGEIGDLKDQRTMAQMLETQAQSLMRMDEQAKDESIPPIMKEPYSQFLQAFLLPLVTRVFRPMISEIGSMGLPASIYEDGVMLAATRRVGEVPHIATYNCTGYYAMDCEGEYAGEIADTIRAEFTKMMHAERNKHPDKKVKLHMYIPLIFGTLRDIEYNPVKFAVTSRFAITRAEVTQ